MFSGVSITLNYQDIDINSLPINTKTITPGSGYCGIGKVNINCKAEIAPEINWTALQNLTDSNISPSSGTYWSSVPIHNNVINVAKGLKVANMRDDYALVGATYVDQYGLTKGAMPPMFFPDDDIVVYKTAPVSGISL